MTETVTILVWGDAPLRNPKEWVIDTPKHKKDLVAKYLDYGGRCVSGGSPANCVICDKFLGDCRYSDGRYVWPEQASHYVLKHNVWVPEHEELFAMLSWRVIRP